MTEVADKIRLSFHDLIKDKKTLIKILSIAVILMIALVLRVHKSGQSEVTVEASTESQETEELYIDISGAVQRPGVYKVDNGTRLYEVIELAGGLRSDADTNSVNQAAFVEDGAKIIIPAAVMYDTSGESEGTESGVTSQNYSTPGLININTADKEGLKTLTGIGDVIAERIIEYRAQNRFKTKEDIMLVKGIGNSIFEKIKDDITV